MSWFAALNPDSNPDPHVRSVMHKPSCPESAYTTKSTIKRCPCVISPSTARHYIHLADDQRGRWGLRIHDVQLGNRHEAKASVSYQSLGLKRRARGFSSHL